MAFGQACKNCGFQESEHREIDIVDEINPAFEELRNLAITKLKGKNIP